MDSVQIWSSKPLPLICNIVFKFKHSLLSILNIVRPGSDYFIERLFPGAEIKAQQQQWEVEPSSVVSLIFEKDSTITPISPLHEVQSIIDMYAQPMDFHNISVVNYRTFLCREILPPTTIIHANKLLLYAVLPRGHPVIKPCPGIVCFHCVTLATKMFSMILLLLGQKLFALDCLRARERRTKGL